MTEDIEFLAWSRKEESANELKRSLAAFQAANQQTNISVSIPVPEMMWTDIVKTAIYGHGADIAEVGSTYIESLKEMNSLRPFTKQEIASFGGAEAFVRSVWEAGVDKKEQQVWAIPWRTDSRVIFYRRDLFAKAGIQEENAFQTPAHMEATLQALQASGIEVPLTLGTTSAHALTTFTACWVWGAGGDYISAAGDEVIFNSPKAREGFHNYFNLGRYLAPAARKLDIDSSDRLFSEGKAAVTYAGTWLPDAMDKLGSTLTKENLGIAFPPGVPIVGGTHLVVWKHSKQERRAVDLIRFLTSKATLIGYPRSIDIPARLDALNDDIFSNNMIYQTFIEAIKTGRSVPAVSLWALVEDRLGKTLLQIWEKLYSQPDANIDELIAESVESLATRLNATLNSK